MTSPGDAAPLAASWRSEGRVLGRLSASLAWVQFNFCLTGLVDMALAGRAGALELGAAGLGAAFFTVACSLAQVGGLGAEPFICQALGAQAPEQARAWLLQGLYTAVLASVPVCLAAWAVAACLGAFGLTPPLAAAAQAYLWARLPALPLFGLMAVLRAYLQASHRTAVIGRSALVMNLVNFILAYALLFGDAGLRRIGLPAMGVPPLGVFGLGLAGTIANGVQAACLAAQVMRDRLPSDPRRVAISWPAVRRVLGVGVPVSLHLLAEVGIFTVAGFTVGGMGEHAMAAHQAALMVASTSFHLCLGIADATAVQVGRAVGAGNQVATFRRGLVGLGLSLAVMSLSATCFVTFPATLLRLISPDPAVIAAGTGLLAIAAVFQLVDGLQAVAAGALRGCGYTRVSFIANVVAHWGIGVPAIYWLSVRRQMGPQGVWWGLVAGLSVACVVLVGCFVKIARRQVQPLRA